MAAEEAGEVAIDPNNLSPERARQIVPEVLRRLHAGHAEALAGQAWTTKDGQQIYLIDDPELRQFYAQDDRQDRAQPLVVRPEG